MKNQTHLPFIKNTKPIALYSSKQIYAMEQAWFADGHDSFGLMQQAAWQMAQHIEQLTEQRQHRARIWVGKGNNGGDGWLIAYYLQQMGWQVQVVTVGFTHQDLDISDTTALSDASRARQTALKARCPYQRFEDSADDEHQNILAYLSADVYIDALFGIGLNRIPDGIYKEAIDAFNTLSRQNQALIVAVDIPSGLVASTGEVFDRTAIQADVTLCLIARKFGLHTKDGTDYSGDVFDIALIPYQINSKECLPVAKLLTTAHNLTPRRQNSYKGSYGHVLIIGGNRIDGSQGMGGAAILAASSSMAAGAGKITVACHKDFHGAQLTALPDAMTLNLHDVGGVEALVQEASVIAIGMGLGRDKTAKSLFVMYLQAIIAAKKPVVIDADGLYHLASLRMERHELISQLREYSANNQAYLTPHSGEAARLLDKTIEEVEADRLSAIKQCASNYGGSWVLKGSGSLVLEQNIEEQVYVCGVGNAGMATAGMGDVLSGLMAGLLAQQDLEPEGRSLHQAVILHGLAGDILVNQTHDSHSNDTLLIGQRGLQAQDMPAAIRHVMHMLIN